MARPLYLESANSLRELSDANMDRIQYWLRQAYANQLNAGGDGAIFTGGTGTTIGSKTDTSSTANTNTNTRNYTPGTDYPAYPSSIGSETDATYTYKQDRTVPGNPSTATYDSNGYLIFDGSTGLKMINSLSDVQSEIFTDALSQMRTGDEVGTYRVSTTSPGTGWVNKGTWFSDTTYSGGTTTYRLWLRTSATALGTAPSSRCVVPSTSGIIEDSANITLSSGFISSILLPLFTKWIGDGNRLDYSVATSVSGINRGSFADTKQTASSTDQWFTSPTYYSRRFPSGSKITQSTHYLNLT